LNVRDAEGRDPIRIVVDPMARTPSAYHVASTSRNQQTILLASTNAPLHRVEELEGVGGVVMRLPTNNGRFVWRDDFERQATNENLLLSSIMCEGGGALAESVLTAHVVDELRINTSSVQLHAGVRVHSVSDSNRWVLHNVDVVADNVLSTYV